MAELGKFSGNSMKPSRSVLSKDDADKVAVAYHPRKFPATVSPMASGFMAFNASANGGTGSSFQIDQIVAEQTGMAQLERLHIEEKIEQEALARIKDLQEQAYEQAYALGLEEGREKAFNEKRIEFSEKLEHFQELIGTIELLKSELVASNESQILRLVVYLVRRLAMAEIQTNQELILEVIRSAIASAQTDESITVRLSPSDMAFVEETRATLGKEFDSLKRAKIESADSITNGGCIIETNYGDVDATMEQRFEKVWTAISEKLPKVKNVVGV